MVNMQQPSPEEKILKPVRDLEKDYFRTDVKISVKRNRKKSTVTWSLDVQNATSNKNVAGEYFDPLTSTTKISYQTPLIPILAYRVEF